MTDKPRWLPLFSNLPLKIGDDLPKDKVIFVGNGNDSNRDAGEDSATGIAIDTITRIDKPRLYKVLLLNDDFTPMDFVIFVLQKFFQKSDAEATKIMLAVHEQGAGLAGIYTLEIAEMKSMQVHQLAKQNQYPLKCSIEPEPGGEK